MSPMSISKASLARLASVGRSPRVQSRCHGGELPKATWFLAVYLRCLNSSSVSKKCTCIWRYSWLLRASGGAKLVTSTCQVLRNKDAQCDLYHPSQPISRVHRKISSMMTIEHVSGPLLSGSLSTKRYKECIHFHNTSTISLQIKMG